MELPFQDTNDFNLEYIGIIFQNHNHTETSVVLDIKDCTLIDGKGEAHEITELEGSHVLYFDEENWQWNLLTTQCGDFVKTFEDIYGGKLVVDAEVGFLEPLLDIDVYKRQSVIRSFLLYEREDPGRGATGVFEGSINN